MLMKLVSLIGKFIKIDSYCDEKVVELCKGVG